jgi:hypothetical protein
MCARLLFQPRQERAHHLTPVHSDAIKVLVQTIPGGSRMAPLNECYLRLVAVLKFLAADAGAVRNPVAARNAQVVRMVLLGL